MDSREKCPVQNRKMSLKIKAELFEDKKNIYFLYLGTSKTLSLGELFKSKN